MNQVQESKDKAIQQLRIAEHLLTTTLPLVKDPKLLIGIIHNLHNTTLHAIDALLFYERPKLILPQNATFNYKFELLRTKILPTFNIPEEHLKLITTLKDLTTKQKQSPVEFKRKDLHVICSKDYELQTISTSEAHSYLNQTKEFLNTVLRITDYTK